MAAIALFSGSAAFAPAAGLRTAAPSVHHSTVVAKLDMAGSGAPLGFFDPLGFSKGASPETMKKYRECELKHGRVAMLACAGMITADKFHPLFGGTNSANPLEALTQVRPTQFFPL